MILQVLLGKIWINWVGPYQRTPFSTLRWNYEILRFKGPFSGSCWRFLAYLDLFRVILTLYHLGEHVLLFPSIEEANPSFFGCWKALRSLKLTAIFYKKRYPPKLQLHTTGGVNPSWMTFIYITKLSTNRYTPEQVRPWKFQYLESMILKIRGSTLVSGSVRMDVPLEARIKRSGSVG